MFDKCPEILNNPESFLDKRSIENSAPAAFALRSTSLAILDDGPRDPGREPARDRESCRSIF